MALTDPQALELIVKQPETALKLEEYAHTSPRFGLIGQAAALTSCVALFLVGVAAILDTLGGPSVNITAPAVVFAAAGFFFTRLVTDALEGNKRDAVARQLGDLVQDDGKLSDSGQKVIRQLEAVRENQTVEVSGATTPIEALGRAAAKQPLPPAAGPPQIGPTQP